MKINKILMMQLMNHLVSLNWSINF